MQCSRIGNSTRTSYFCADGFGDREARVFCQMLSWEFGKAINIPEQTPNSSIQIDLDIGMHLKDLDCQSSDPHILDCDPTFDADGLDQVGCPNGLRAAVECSPGYPLTLRVFNPIEDEIPPGKVVKIGYPVIDTPVGAGYLCDSQMSDEVVPMICKSLGMPLSRKLNPGMFGNPDPAADPLLVMDKITCSGDERSIFECDLGPYGDHQCSMGQVLTILCAEEEADLMLDPVIVDPATSASAELTVNGKNGVSAIETSFGIIPMCQDPLLSARQWTDLEADITCQANGFLCGMRNRTEEQLLADFPSDSRVVSNAFATADCRVPEPTSLLDCQLKIRTSCSETAPSGSTVCLDSQQDSDYDLCLILRQTVSDQSNVESDLLLPILMLEEVTLGINFDHSPTSGANDSCRSSSIISPSSSLFVGSDLKAKANGLQVLPGSEQSVKVSAKLIDSAEEVLHERWNEDQRGCKMILADEEGEVYSQSKCEERCRAEFLVQTCGCLPWHLSRINLGVSTSPYSPDFLVGAQMPFPSIWNYISATFTKK